MSTSGDRSDDALAETALSPGSVPDATATETAADPIAAQHARQSRQIGRYKIERELGIGGMGVVHAAYDPDLERRVAVKLVLRATSDESRQRFLREARAMAKLVHPNIVTVYEIGSEDGRDFVSMELVDGGSLAEWLRAEKRPTRDVIDAFLAAGRGLAAAHDAGIIHRDFKPHNVLRSSSGRIVVGDFGLACGLQSQEPPEKVPVDAFTTLTATGSWVGTPAYMAPEQWNGGAITPATDQFAFSVALWEALAGSRPFRGDDVEQLRDAVTAGPAKLDARVIPRRYRAVLRRGLDPDPAKRWPSMHAMLAQLVPRRRSAYLIAAGVLLAIAGLVVALVVMQSRATQSEDTIEALRGSAEKLAEKARQDAENARRILKETTKAVFENAEILKQIRREPDGRVTAPQIAITELVRELEQGEAVRLVPTTGKKFGYKAYAIRPGSFLEAIGVQLGDTLVAIDQEQVTTREAFLVTLAKKRTATTLALDLVRRTKPFTIAIRAVDEVELPGLPPPGAPLPGMPPPPRPPDPP